MIEKTLSKRYAAAMLAAAERENAVEEVEANLLALKVVYERDRAFRQALEQPMLPRAARLKILRRPFEGRVTPSFLKFLDLLVRKNRISLLPDIADTFDRLADATKGIVRVQARTAFPLTAAQRGALVERLGRITGKQVDLQEAVDPAVKGGLAVRIGDTVIDGTVARRLKALREKLFEMQRR